ncbi:MAG: molecular chaperone DnaJ [Gammaproteobacteria bacterium]|nr:MAG: molecular chaperone DnaJ [Gammaproteobacteria bacterium]
MLETPSALETLIETLTVQVHGVLAAHPEGLSEHALIQRLAATDGPLAGADLKDPLALFRTHFLLFHVLYRLRDRLVAEEALDLEIGPLCIRCRPLDTIGRQALDRADPLRAYYLDLTHLQETDRAAVEALLDDFWQRLAAGESRQEDLATLGFESLPDRGTLRRRFRRLAMAHHPDRGGDAETFQRIQAAYARLARSLP